MNDTPALIPNPEQHQAIEDFLSFMLSDEKEYHLTGGAGVGKTFTLKKIMREGMKEYEAACALLGQKQTIFTMALTATTNKAAEVLASSTGLPAVTVHSYFGLKVFEDYETGETKIKPGKNHEIKRNELIIIDEASMIDAKLYKILQESVKNCKFLYVGDHCQMAPVFEKLSLIYNNKKFFSNLTIPMRNAGQPALMALCAQLRETVETGVFKPIQEVPGVIDYLDGPQMQQMVDQTFIQNDPDSRILCFRNQQVKDFNEYIRGLRKLPSYYTEGEALVCANAYTMGEHRLSIEEEVIVTKNYEQETTHKLDDSEYAVYRLRVAKRSGVSFDVFIPSEPTHFNALIKYYAKEKKWFSYFKLKQEYPDLRPKDASTVYKAQGSTYDSVFVDLEDISRCTQADQVARMLYVACSRPRNRLFLYGQLKPAYRGG